MVLGWIGSMERARGSMERASCSLHCFLARRLTCLSLPISCVQWSRLKLTLTLFKRPSKIYCSQRYSVKLTPSLEICVSLLFWHPLKGTRPTWLTVWSWSSTAVCCVHDNNSIACRFYYLTGHVRGSYGGVKKTSSFETCVSEIKNGKSWFHSTLGSAAVS